MRVLCRLYGACILHRYRCMTFYKHACVRARATCIMFVCVSHCIYQTYICHHHAATSIARVSLVPFWYSSMLMAYSIAHLVPRNCMSCVCCLCVCVTGILYVHRVSTLVRARLLHGGIQLIISTTTRVIFPMLYTTIYKFVCVLYVQFAFSIISITGYIVHSFVDWWNTRRSLLNVSAPE